SHRTRALYAALHRLPVQQQRALQQHYQLADFTVYTGERLAGNSYRFSHQPTLHTLADRRKHGLATLRTDGRLADCVINGAPIAKPPLRGAIAQVMTLLNENPVLSSRKLAALVG